MASRISGVGVHTIRAWEKRYSAVTPLRNNSGRRVYSQIEIERLSMLSELCSLGHTIGHIANWSNEELKDNLKKLGKIEGNGEVKSEVLSFGSVNSGESLDSLVLALKMYKLDVISHEFNKLKLVLSPKQLAFDIIQPLMVEVGNLIRKGEINLSQEQALMSLIKFHMGAALYKQVQHKSKKPVSILITTPEGDFDEMVILLSALLAANYNLNFYYLGPNLPVSSLVEASKSINPSHIILGTTPMIDLDGHFLNQYIERLLSYIDSNQTLILRGSSSMVELQTRPNFHLAKSLKHLDDYLKVL